MIFEMYGRQSASRGWYSRTVTPPSPDRRRANLGQPLEQLAGEPDPLALWCLFKGYATKGKGSQQKRRHLAERYFGVSHLKPGPKPKGGRLHET